MMMNRNVVVFCVSTALLVGLFGISCISEDEDNDDQGEAFISELDPAPEWEEPGLYGCDDCPTSELDTANLNVGDTTSHTFSGNVTDSIGDGIFYIRNASGQEIAGPMATDESDGSFTFTAPLFCGTQLMKFVWNNPAGAHGAVRRIITEDCVEPDIRVTLLWDDLGRDWELHLINDGGQINDPATDCTWNTCIGTFPDWGVQGDPSDDPRKDVDDTGYYGPENIYLSGPVAGTYTVMVEHWASGDPASAGRVIFNIKGQRAVLADIEGLAPRHVWTAGTIEWPSGDVTVGSDIYDCTGDWSNGCQAEVP